MLPSALRRMSGAVQDTAVAEENVIWFLHVDILV
jgi:hypothetical protein